MWGDNKVWMHYTGILAADEQSAQFLSGYLRFMAIQCSYLSSAEVIDLQRYKVIKPPSRKLKLYVHEKTKEPFIFHHCNN